MKQCCRTVFPHGLVCGVARACMKGLTCVYSLALDVKCFCICFLLLGSSHWFYSHSSHGKYVVSILVSTDFQCDGAWWLPLPGLSWIPYMFSSACPVAPPWSGHIPQTHLLLMGLNLGLLLRNVNLMLKHTHWHIACNECVVFLLWIGSIFQTLEPKRGTTLKNW